MHIYTPNSIRCKKHILCLSLVGDDIMRKELIINVHIPKTGGTTFRSQILGRQYGKKLLWLQHYPPGGYHIPSIEYIAKKIKMLSPLVITGHFGYNMWFNHLNQMVLPKLNLNRKISHITILRDPVDRYISSHYYLHQLERSHNIKAKYETLEERVMRGDADNVQTLWLAGGVLDVDKAKHNLLHEFKSFGILERFDESVMLMNSMFGWNSRAYVKTNVNTTRPQKHNISPSIIAKIDEIHAMDRELYEFALKLFDARLAARKNHLHKYRQDLVPAIEHKNSPPKVSTMQKYIRRKRETLSKIELPRSRRRRV